MGWEAQARPARTNPGRDLLYFLGGSQRPEHGPYPRYKGTGTIHVFPEPLDAVKNEKKMKLADCMVVNATGSDP